MTLVSLASTGAATESPRLETVADGLESPWCLAFLPDGGFLVTELAGQLKRLDPSGRVVADIAGVPDVYYAGQGGLFDVALDPEFAANQRIFLAYAGGSPNENATMLARARLADDRLIGLEVIHRVTPPKDTPVHYGGRLLFLDDGTLLLTTGDGFDYREAAQDLASELGKVLRLDADGKPAAGNPFPAAPTVWTWGHRNPQGLAQAPDGTVYLHEHGPRGGDEVNVLVPGSNYGWPAITHGVDYSGALVTPFTSWPGMTQPLRHWTPSIAPSGLAVYNGDDFPRWRGDLFVGALVDREVRRLDIEDGLVVAEERLFAELDERIRDVRSGPDGSLYIVTDGTPGRILKVVANP